MKTKPDPSEVTEMKVDSRINVEDLIQIHPALKGKPLHNLLFKVEGVASQQGGVGLEIQLTFIHRELARRSLEKLLAWDFDKLIIAYGPCIERDAKPLVERAFQWLTR